MNILAFDVGIKHLGLCLLIKKEDNKFDIEKWINIDLTDTKQITCEGLMKNKEICGKGASYYTDRDGIKKYYCKKHMNEEEEIDITKLVQDNPNKENKCKVCGSGAKFIVKEQEYCTPHKNSVIKKIVKDNSVKPIKKEKSLSSEPQLLYNAIHNKLEGLDYLKTVNEVYIENQPAFKNPIMKSVSLMLFSYFASYSIRNKLNIIVKFVSPSFKIGLTKELIEFTDSYVLEHDKEKKKDCKCRICKLKEDLKTNKEKLEENYAKYKFSYDALKEIGVVYTKKILKDNNILDKFKLLDVCDKKDDLCDAFLHGYRKL